MSKDAVHENWRRACGLLPSRWVLRICPCTAPYGRARFQQQQHFLAAPAPTTMVVIHSASFPRLRVCALLGMECSTIFGYSAAVVEKKFSPRAGAPDAKGAVVTTDGGVGDSVGGDKTQTKRVGAGWHRSVARCDIFKG